MRSFFLTIFPLLRLKFEVYVCLPLAIGNTRNAHVTNTQL